jgi:multidrug efflux pump subunit AcrB
MRHQVVLDSTTLVKATITEVLRTLAEAFVLVVLVVFLFLGSWRATLVPIIAVPVSLIGAFAVLFALGYSANTITLLALVPAIGIVVDDAIVVVENVERIMEEEGLPPAEAARKAMREITGPIIAITLVLLSVFVPVGFIPGITGALYRQFAVAVSAAVIISAINALTLSPALCALLLRPGGHRRPIHLSRLRQSLRGGRRPPIDRLGRRRLRQCDVREFLRHPRMRTDRSASLPISQRGADGRLSVHRRLLQSLTPPLGPGLSFAHRIPSQSPRESRPPIARHAAGSMYATQPLILEED